ncbi:helix-turn-helix transcriptional regulator [Aeromicrobium duanguangcaii]|uniref:LuxR C-terminal-related transcriptional regulator n=1 Tax=Aeromicrobium duanguangcaii TaxID=2968086 RepID=A0ABY5KFF6_9ACTN|nr:LuxR C-terminal-related transcriptional regulator [Aeromicrobium duanguangcaii]MCD9152888.1 LuxR C-terminal-related transcriptional regulator [Aeromicrobium duanguangcaii]UUI67133.1 LuxR C-terminal-related transcriptional regulator [Aeromicrobium duanguangcaii]
MTAVGPRGPAEAFALEEHVLGPVPRAAHAAARAGWPGVPGRPSHFLSRHRLLDLLDAASSCRLVLVRAPAGSGKTALVSDWVSRRASGRVEWVTFERGDLLWPGILGALVRWGIPAPPGSGLQRGTTLGPEARRALVRTVARARETLTVVLDGPEIDSLRSSTDLDLLLRHGGGRLRVVLLTRDEPALPLYRYRLDDAMIEIGPADLAFTRPESELLLAGMGVRAPTDVLDALQLRTAGWVTGLRFLGHALAGEEDSDAAIARVTADSGDIAEYLRAEVLARRSPNESEFLMAMSVPATLPPGLVAVLGGRSAARMLAGLGRSNAFIDAVPGLPGHHRLAPFFRAFLRAELAHRSPQRAIELHRQTADWLAGHHRPGPPPQRRAAGESPPPRPVEPLTTKELEVLEHLGELLTTEEIASAMYISVNTVRTHVRHILRKLGVSRRNAAVRVARQYELLGR